MRITGGRFKNQTLKSPKGEQTRPTSERLRETLFNILQTAIEGKTFLDLYAGSGAVGIEAISRGACFATFIEKDPRAIHALQENIKKFGIQAQTKVFPKDVLSCLKHFKKRSFDFIFIDPPYGKGLQAKTLEWIDDLGLLAEGGRLFLEESIHTEVNFSPYATLQLKKKRKGGNTILYELT
jgi:16S rRNA (guanine(966)-N(2))-methyltransferase RsmD